MKIRNTQVTLPRSATARRAGVLPIAALLITGALTGCESSSDGAFDEFVGTWKVEPVTSQFALTCTFLTRPLQFPLWDVLEMGEGVLSDLAETSGACPFFYDVVQKTATVPNPDPYTGKAPICRLDQSTDMVTAFLEFQPMNWKFNLLQPQKGQPPRAQMIGTAVVPLIVVDPATGAEIPDPEGPCLYDVRADLTKIAKK